MKTLARVLLVLVALSACAAPSLAALISRDWLTPGDGLLTFDSVNRREWLDVPFTMTNFSSPPRNIEPRFQAVQLATQPGGLLAGFTIAQSEDVRELAVAGGIDVSSTLLEVNESAVRNLVSLLGASYSFPASGDVATIGLLDEVQTNPNGITTRSAGNFFVFPVGAGFGPTTVAQLGDSPPAIAGVLLYRDAVPEPNSLYLAAIVATISLACYLVRRCNNAAASIAR